MARQPLWLRAAWLCCLWLFPFALARPAGLSWSLLHQAVGGATLWGVAAGADRVVAVGTAGKILLSTDGLQWTEQNSGTAEWLLGAAYGAGKFIVVGDHGTILQSTDGKIWSAASAVPTTARLNNVAFGGGTFLAVGEGGTLLSSDNGNQWFKISSGFSGWLRGIAFGHGNWVVTGESGAVLSSWPSFHVVSFVPFDVEAVSFLDTENAFLNTQNSPNAAYPNAPISVFSYDWFGLGGADGQWTTAQALTSSLRDLHLVGPTQTLASTRFRALVSAAGIAVLGGSGGTVLEKTSGSSSRDDFHPSSIGSSADLNGGAVFGDAIYLIGADETIARGTGVYRSRLSNVSTRLLAQPGEAAPIAGLSSTDPATSSFARSAHPSRLLALSILCLIPCSPCMMPPGIWSLSGRKVNRTVMSLVRTRKE